MYSKNKQHNKNKGFTLIELLVAIGILLILAAIATPFLTKHIKDARASQIAEQIYNIKTAFESYYTKKEGIIEDSVLLNDSFLEELVSEGFLRGMPPTEDLDWSITRHAVWGVDGEYYCLKVQGSSPDGVKLLASIAPLVDEKLDGERNKASGRLQYDDSIGVVVMAYTLHSDGNYFIGSNPCLSTTGGTHMRR